MAEETTLGKISRRRVALGASVLAGVGVLAVAWSRGRSDGMEQPGAGVPAADADIRQVAALAGVRPDEVQPSTGGVHVPYHITRPLPEPGQPRADGKVTLVWFSATW
ncbi:MAG: hypothetical protein HY332_24460 [Chloroflexi bacterium]|nr:hypothetical protein [Chloroflexota bacterium]